MGHGRPDASNVVSTTDLYQVTDMAELAARLGSILTYRRSGEVVYLDDFSHGLAHWVDDSAAEGADITLQNDVARSKGVGARLDVPAGGAGIANLRGYFPVVGSERISAQAEFCIAEAVGAVEIAMTHYDRATAYTWRMRYSPDTSILSYFDADAAYTALADPLYLTQLAHFFHNLKLTIDLSTGEYVRVTVNDNDYSMAGIAAYSTPSAVGPYVRVTFGARSATPAARFVYLDNLILTRNEV